MKIRNGNTPIQLPELIRTGDPITARWANSIRTALQRLRDRTPVVNAGNGTTLHPFQIVTAYERNSPTTRQLRLYVNFGQSFESFLVKRVTIPTVNEYYNALNEITISDDALLNDPRGLTAGYIALSASTTYGIWLEGGIISAGTTTDFFPDTSLGYGYMTVDAYTMFYNRVVADSTHTDPDDPPNDEQVWLYIGKVEVDSALLPTITQWWKSDIILPSFLMPRIEVSQDAGNSAYLSSDDARIYVPPIVSTDASNSITQGSDGGAFYDAP
jgi:hypothetical protein